jgi:tetratricopeptide (TPR) repeat protein
MPLEDDFSPEVAPRESSYKDSPFFRVVDCYLEAREIVLRPGVGEIFDSLDVLGKRVSGYMLGKVGFLLSFIGNVDAEKAKGTEGIAIVRNALVLTCSEYGAKKAIIDAFGVSAGLTIEAVKLIDYYSPSIREVHGYLRQGQEAVVQQFGDDPLVVSAVVAGNTQAISTYVMLKVLAQIPIVAGKSFLAGVDAIEDVCKKTPVFTKKFCQEFSKHVSLYQQQEAEVAALWNRGVESFLHETAQAGGAVLKETVANHLRECEQFERNLMAGKDAVAGFFTRIGSCISDAFAPGASAQDKSFLRELKGMDLTMTGRVPASDFASGMSQTPGHLGARRGGLFDPFREPSASHTGFRPSAEIPVFLQGPNIAESLLPGLSQGVYAGVGDRLSGGRIAGDGFSSPFLPEALRISGTGQQPFLQNLQQFSQAIHQHCGEEALGMVAQMTQDIADQHAMRTRDFFATPPPIPQVGDNITFQTTTTSGGDVQTTAIIPVPNSGDNAKVGVGISAAGVVTLSLKLALTGPQTAIAGGALLVAGGAYLAWDELISPTILRGKGTDRIANALKKDWVDSAERNFQRCLSENKFSTPEQRRSYADLIADASIKRMGGKWGKKTPEEQAKFVLSKNPENTNALATLAEIGLQKAVKDKQYYGDAIGYADRLKRALGADAKRYGDLLSRVYTTFSGDRIEGGEPDVARGYLDEARRLNPSDKKIQSHVSYLRGIIAQKEDDLTIAASHFQEAEQLNPAHLDSKRSRVGILLQQEDSASALALQKTITTSAGSTSKDTLLLAHLCSDQGNKEEAIKLYESYSTKNPEDKEARIFLMDEQVRGGQYAEALQSAQEYEAKFGKDEKVTSITDAVQQHSDMEQKRSDMAAAQRSQELVDEALQPSRLERGLETAAVIANAASAGIAFFAADQDLRRARTERREQAVAHERERANITIYGLPAPRPQIAAWRQEAPAATSEGRSAQRTRAFHETMSGNF